MSPLMDFLSEDDAWYSVRLQLAADKLLVMYIEFAEDEVYSADGFTSIESVEEFRRRFRPASLQLQDKNCDVIMKSMVVCASNRFAEDDLRFYDAIVESVNPSIHPLLEGECRCKFELLWQHGPLKGTKTILGIENVCILKSRDAFVDATLEKFLDIVMEKLKAKDILSASKLECPASNLTQNSIPSIRTCTSEETSSHAARGKSSDDNIIDDMEQDFDMGGETIKKHKNLEKKKAYFCRIDNLEKDLSPFTLVHFIQEHIGIRCSTFIIPSMPHEFCTKGFIFLEEKNQVEKLMSFLLNKEYIIASMKGRPWIIGDACFGITQGVMPTYEVKLYNTMEEQAVQIKLIYKGTAEYEKIEKLRLLHSEFLEHVNYRLMGRLLAEERKLMKQLDEE